MLAVMCHLQDNTESVKLIIKDLPLYEVSNQDVLATLKENFEVLSEVKYSNVFIDGKHTYLWNGDRFVYISPDQVTKVPLTLNCQAFIARIVKPPQFQTYHRCGQIGHCAALPNCPALALDKV